MKLTKRQTSYASKDITTSDLDENALGTTHPEGHIVHIVLRKPIMNSYILCAGTLQKELQRALAGELPQQQDESEVFKKFNTMNQIKVFFAKTANLREKFKKEQFDDQNNTTIKLVKPTEESRKDMWNNTDTDNTEINNISTAHLELDEKQLKTLFVQSMMATIEYVWEYVHIDETSAVTWDRLTTMTQPEVL